MNWVVESTADAEDELADLWVRAADRAAVTVAQAEIERRLTRNPLTEGEELSEGLWKVAVDPLVAYFEVDADRR